MYNKANRSLGPIFACDPYVKGITTCCKAKWTYVSFPLFITFKLYFSLQIKCLKYWPSASPEMYGPVLVSPGDEEELADYVVRKFSIQMVCLP